MRTFQNPFRSRASEQIGDTVTFLRTFGPGALALLPGSLWDRLLVFRSAPGAGKTSMMRAFAIESLSTLAKRDDLPELSQFLHDVGALRDGRPAVLGVHLRLERDYRALRDTGAPDDTADLLFYELLDARILANVLRAALGYKGLRFPDDVNRCAFQFSNRSANMERAFERVGGTGGGVILEWARGTEDRMLSILDSLSPIRWNEVRETGHRTLYSLQMLSAFELCVDGEPIAARPLLLLDDGEMLAPSQRRGLLELLSDRSLGVARWYAERYDALSHQEVMASAGREGRDYELVELENVARGTATEGEQPRFRPGQFERVLSDIGDRRAAWPLAHYAELQETFSELLEVDRDSLLEGVAAPVVSVVSERARAAAKGDARYKLWIEEAGHLKGFDAAIRWRELEILIARDRDRTQQEMFEHVLAAEEVGARSSSAIREAALASLAREFNLPMYSGAENIAKLGSHNVEQFLSLCGDIFSEMLAQITLQRRPALTAREQDRIVRRASERLWREIPRRLEHGRHVQRLLTAVAEMAKAENEKLTLPYPPGVTGTALLMQDRERLLDSQVRQAIPGAEELFLALSEATKLNLVSAELDRPVKGSRCMVIYLNRLLCPRFGLPLGRGGFREKRLEVMASWLGPTKNGSSYTTGHLPL